jgi:chromosome segregation ATPase
MSEKATIEAELRANQAETAAVEQVLKNFDATQTKLRGELGDLQRAERDIGVALSELKTGGNPVDILPQEVAITASLHENLQRQLSVLQNLRNNAQGFSTKLDPLIKQLEARITELRAQRAAAEEALTASVADLVMRLGNLPPSLNVAGLRLDTKTALISADAALKKAFIDKVANHFAHLPPPMRDAVVGVFASRVA